MEDGGGDGFRAGTWIQGWNPHEMLLQGLPQLPRHHLGMLLAALQLTVSTATASTRGGCTGSTQLAASTMGIPLRWLCFAGSTAGTPSWGRSWASPALLSDLGLKQSWTKKCLCPDVFWKARKQKKSTHLFEALSEAGCTDARVGLLPPSPDCPAEAVKIHRKPATV